jgi:two-component system, NtrC family, nitrogen regulation sensor histidine kinase NtrY
MSLAVRLLLALGLVAVFVTVLVGFAVRRVSHDQLKRDFEARIKAATEGVRGELVWEASTLSEQLGRLCQQNGIVDELALDLARVGGNIEKLPQNRGTRLKKDVPDAQKALRLDDLWILDASGVVIAAGDLAQIGTRNRSLTAETSGRPQLVWRRGKATVQVHCKREGGHGVTLGVVGARQVEPILERVGRAYGVNLSLRGGDGEAGPDAFESHLRIEQIAGLEVTASISQQPLFEALATIDSSMVLIGGIAVLVSVAMAVFIARGLSQPLVELAQETREVVRGSPKPVRARGGRELAQLARSFNRTIDELTSIRKRLARTERIAARREVARQIAHEIKNPLAPIRAAVETLRRLRARNSDQFDGYFDEATRTVLDEVHRIKTIVGEFTKYARMPPPQFQKVELEALARGVVALHDSKGVDDGPRVELHCEAGAAALVDHDQIVQVLTNLVQNGIEAARGAGIAPVVKIDIASISPTEVSIAVVDNGPGIDPSVRERLFEPYVTTKKEGTGLGLSIVQTIVHEHGGELSAEDGPDGGARFEVVLPVEGPPYLEKAPTSGSTTV